VTRLISLPEHQRLHRRIVEIDRLARTLAVTDLTTAPMPPDRHQAWLAAIDLAAERCLPLWSDDIALRSVAARRGIATFGTWALLTALIEVGLIPDTRREDARDLADEGVVYLPAIE
jgi:predicted nucleic acid-binding protein